ncbi:cell division protein ZapE [Devriesea agamarum]|uniref:cell division protein ZapE n=1 Tax=Devriesea agamarum TaxID=472569 RepID=UPI00071C53DE|nr:cell division protein ZapE [Devriesea agamarum]
MTDALTARHPAPSLDRLVADLVPPPRFAQARLGTYQPDPAYPSQAEAKDRIQLFADELVRRSAPRTGLRGLFGGRRPATAHGIYLDGGFGVGKTHLLTSLFHIAPGRPVYGTFVEYTNLAGALGFTKAVELLSGASVVCIDEFELDDPGDTLMMTRMIRELSDRGVAIVATSNTLPDALGEGRFAAQDFLREIQAMAERFDVLRIDGEDYRRREVDMTVLELDDEQVRQHANRTPGASLDSFDELLAHLATVHPSRYGALVDDIACAHLTGVHAVSDHHAALRLVVLVDRLYDREIPVLASGTETDTLFTDDLLRSGYRKKYFRALSRLTSLTRDGAAVLARE